MSQQQTVDLPKADVSSLAPSSLTNSENGNVCIEVLSRSQSRKAINAAAKAAARAVESPEITVSRRAANAEKQRITCQQQTPETATARRAADAERQRLSRQQETPETATARRAANAKRMVNTRSRGSHFVQSLKQQYLNDFDCSIHGPLDKQQFTVDEMKKFHDDMAKYNQHQCTVCKELWPTKEVPTTSNYICPTCKKEKNDGVFQVLFGKRHVSGLFKNS